MCLLTFCFRAGRGVRRARRHCSWAGFLDASRANLLIYTAGLYTFSRFYGRLHRFCTRSTAEATHIVILERFVKEPRPYEARSTKDTLIKTLLPGCLPELEKIFVSLP